MKLPAHILVLDLLGALAVGLALVNWTSADLLPAALRMGQPGVFLGFGVVLLLPMVRYVGDMARAAERGESGRWKGAADRPADLQAASPADLADIEGRVRYRCKPIPDLYARDATVYASMVMGALLAGFSAFFMVGTYRTFHSVFFVIIAAPVFIAGIYLVLAPWRFKRRARDVEYVVTDTAAYILWRNKPVRGYPLADFNGPMVRIDKRPDGSGSIRLPTAVSGAGGSGGGYREHKDVGFHGIPRIAEFLSAVRRA